MKRFFLFIIFPVVQIAFSIVTGYIALNFAAPSDAVQAGVAYAGVDFSGMDVPEAAAAIKQIDESRISKGIADFVFQDIDFVFHYSEINLSADYSGIENSLVDKSSHAYMSSLLTAFTRKYSSAPKLVYEADAVAFRDKLLHMKTYIDIEPVNADINLSNEGEIDYIPSSQGTYLDVDGYFDQVYKAFLENPFEPFLLDSYTTQDSMVVATVEPRVTDSMLAGIDTILARVSAAVPASLDFFIVSDAAEALNKIWAPKKDIAYGPVSFLRYISEAGLPDDAPSREYDFVASTLMLALLTSGIDYSMMDYAGYDEYTYEYENLYGSGYGGIPGFRVALLQDGGLAGGGGDFRFTNTLNNNIVIFMFVNDGSLNVVIAGSSKNAGRGAAPFEIYSDISGGSAVLYRNNVKIAEKPINNND